MMDYDCSTKELKKRINKMVNTHPERYNVIHEKEGIAVELKPNLTEDTHYNTLFLNNHGTLLVVM